MFVSFTGVLYIVREIDSRFLTNFSKFSWNKNCTITFWCILRKRLARSYQILNSLIRASNCYYTRIARTSCIAACWEPQTSTRHSGIEMGLSHTVSCRIMKQLKTRCLLLVLASETDTSSLKTQELTIKLWG